MRHISHLRDRSFFAQLFSRKSSFFYAFRLNSEIKSLNLGSFDLGIIVANKRVMDLMILF